MTQESNSPLTLAPFAELIADLQAGRMIILVDDANRENEGDLVVATELVTPAHLAFMMQQARGLICVSISSDCAKRLNLPLQTTNNSTLFGTPFAVSIDHVSLQGAGVSAAGRANTLKALIDPRSQAHDFIAPGHVFPLIANDAGVLARPGQTEGSFELARIAGLKPSGVICEILNPDGSLARGPELEAFANKHALKIGSVAQIVRYRMHQEVLVRKVANQSLNTDFGTFSVSVFEDDVERKEHLALVYGNPAECPLVRIHSECLTGDVFGSRRCDCGWQLRQAMQAIVQEGAGIILYLRQEGRGIGLGNKLKAYSLQDKGADTVEANLCLGFAADQRDFMVAARMLQTLGVKALRLMTNNPQKVASLEQAGLVVSERIAHASPVDEYSAGYLKTKRDKLGHLL